MPGDKLGVQKVYLASAQMLSRFRRSLQLQPETKAVLLGVVGQLLEAG